MDIVERLRTGNCANNAGCNTLSKCACADMEDAAEEIARLRAENEKLRGLYDDLLYGVEDKFPGESRHDTAKRYIVERQRSAASGEAQSAEHGGED